MQELAGIRDFEMACEPRSHVGATLPLTPAPYIFKERTAAGEQLAARRQSLLARPTIRREPQGSPPALHLRRPASVREGSREDSGDVAAGSPAKRWVVGRAVGIGRRTSQLAQARKPFPRGLDLELRLAHRLVFSKVHTALGGQRGRRAPPARDRRVLPCRRHLDR